MMVPTAPRADFIIAQAYILFTIFKTRFNGPTHPTRPDEGVYRHSRGGIREIGFEFARADGTSQDQPYAWARQPITHTNDPQHGKIRDERALTALFNDVARPLLRAELVGDV